MNKEEEILTKYINGQAHGEDNKLRATVGLLTARQSQHLSDSINLLKFTLENSVSNLIVNLGHQTTIIAREIEDQVRISNRSIEHQVDKLISSNETLGNINNQTSQKTHKFTMVNIGLTIIMALTGILGLYNVILTSEIKSESIRANQINEQPLLIFTDFNQSPYRITNSGKGVAANFFMIMWDKGNNQLYMTPESGIGEALAVNSSIKIDPSSIIKSDSAEAEKISSVKQLMDIAKQKDTAWFAIMYEDIYGNPFATLIRGPGGEYTENVKFYKLKK